MDKFKKIICIIGVVLLVGLYALTLVAAIFYKEGFDKIFNAALYSTFVIPAFMYAMLLIYKILGGNKDK